MVCVMCVVLHCGMLLFLCPGLVCGCVASGVVLCLNEGVSAIYLW
jgi:hypothetical protein